MNGLNNRLTEAFKDKEYAHAYVDDFLNASIATQIKVLREQRGWNQKQLANKANMKQPRISVMEDVNYNMWSISTLKKLAEAFDVTLKVSFESFSTRIKDIENFNRKSLQRPSRIDDLSSAVVKGRPRPKDFASANQLTLNFDQIDNSATQGLPRITQKQIVAFDTRPSYENEIAKAA